MGGNPSVFAPAVATDAKRSLLLGCTYVVNGASLLSPSAEQHLLCEETALSLYDAYRCAIELGYSEATAYSFGFDEETLHDLGQRKATIKGDSLSLAAFLALIATITGTHLANRMLAASGAIRLVDGAWCCAPVDDIELKISIAAEKGAKTIYLSEAQSVSKNASTIGNIEIIHLPADGKDAIRTFIESLSAYAHRN